MVKASGYDPETGTRTCSMCGNRYPATPEFFTSSKLAPDGCYSRCRSCCAELMRLTRTLDPAYVEREREMARAWYHQNRERGIEYSRSYREAHPERIRVKNANWEKANRPARLAIAHRRRARKRNAPGSHTAADIEAKLTSQDGHCYYCSSSLANGYHVEHLTPLSRGGSDGIENIVLSCPTCNLRKHAKTADEFLNLITREALDTALAPEAPEEE